MSVGPFDPAVVDREETYIGPVDPGMLPSRTMHIAGLDGPLEARILSTHPRRGTTRLVEIPAGWGADGPGAFDADVELFVLDGLLTLGDVELAPHSLLAAGEGDEVTELRCRDEATGLLMTSAPVRFIAPTGSRPPATVSAPSQTGWSVDDEGLVVKLLGVPIRFTTRLVFAGHVVTSTWKRLDAWSERFVISGEWRERGIGPGGETVEYTMGPGDYVSRPAGVAFDGPTAGSSAAALFLDRAVGPWSPVSDGSSPAQ